MVLDLSEEDFDLLAYMAQEQFGPATVASLNKLLEALGYYMVHFDENDVTLEHARLADRSGYLRLIHRPSGLLVEAHLKSQPVLKVMQELMSALGKKVQSSLAQNGEADVKEAAMPTVGRP